MRHHEQTQKAHTKHGGPRHFIWRTLVELEQTIQDMLPTIEHIMSRTPTKHSHTTSHQPAQLLDMQSSILTDQSLACFPPYLIIKTMQKDPKKSRCEVVRGALCKTILTLCENGQTRKILEHVKRQAPEGSHDCTEKHLTMEDIKKIQVGDSHPPSLCSTQSLSDHMCGSWPAWRKPIRSGLAGGRDFRMEG